MSVASARVLMRSRRVVGRIATLLPDAVLRRVLPAGQRPAPAVTTSVDASARTRLFIGPVNSAGQGWQWARAAEQHLPDVAAVSMRVVAANDFGHSADQSVPLGAYRWSHAWRDAQRSTLMSRFTHVIIESARPLFSDLASSLGRDVALLQSSGIKVALLFHGTDIRLPSRHVETEQWSPYASGLWDMTDLLQAQADTNARLVATLGLPVFYSTPDLVKDLPKLGQPFSAHWLPVVIDPDLWSTSRKALSGSRLPLVAHAPSRSVVKGSDLVDPVLKRLEAEGLLEYRRVEGVAAEKMPGLYRGVDIVLDQFRLGSYGVAACEAMAAGRVVVGHVSEFVRTEVRDRTGYNLPIVEATADDLETVLRAIVADSTSYRARAEAGPKFVRTVHDGTLAAEVLSSFLNQSD